MRRILNFRREPFKTSVNKCSLNSTLYGYVRDANGEVDVFGLAVQWVNPFSLNFSQRTMSRHTKNCISLKDTTESMKGYGYDLSKGDPLNVMDVDGQLISYDNRRLLAAQNAELKKVPINVVNPDDVHPDSTTGKTWRQQFDKRRNDKRNRASGGSVPEQGLKAKPLCK